MPNYDWEEYQNVAWEDRFPSWTRGRDEWVLLFRQPLVSPLRVPRTAISAPQRPRVFVSHRQKDDQRALRIAYLANQEGFEFWLDVLDPTLNKLKQSQGQLTKHQEAIAIASIIEMGLLNSSHVLAVMTPNTNGSQWVPYEYGRVKDSPPLTLQAGSWVDPKLTSIPEYLHLGPVTNFETDVVGWLQFEFHRWGPCGGRPAHPWNRPIPPPL